MWGIIFILILNFYISAADVAATLGGTVNLTCKEEGSIFGWYKLTYSGQAWFLLTDNKKYEGSMRTRLTIKIVDTNDAGVYRCFVFDGNNKFKAYGVNITVTLPESPLVPTTTTTASKTTTTSTTTTTTTTTITTTPTTTPTITTTTTPTKTTPTTTTTTPITTTTTPTATNLPAEKQPKFADKVPVIVGTSVAVLFLILCTVIVIIRRRVKKRQESNYETNDMMNAEYHAYGKTDTYHEYCNSAMKQTTATNNDTPLQEGGVLLDRYNVSELTKRLGDADLLKAKMREEFMFLESNGSKVDVLINDNDEVVYTNETGASTAESKMLYIKRSADDIFVFSSLPDDGNVEQFWSVIINNRIENIIMIVQKNEKSSSFYPTQDDVFTVAMLEIEMQSSEKMNDNICLLRFSLYDKKTKTRKPVKIFKTVKWDDSDTHPPVETICSLLDKVKVEEGQPVQLIGSKGKGVSVCGAFSVCLHSVRAIERETTFSLLEYATLLKRIEDDFIKVFEDYEFCYEVMAQYLETLHTYSFIE